VRVLPAERPARSRRLLVGSQVLLVLASLATVPAGLSRPEYLGGAGLLGALYLAVGWLAVRRGRPRDFRRLILASVLSWRPSSSAAGAARLTRRGRPAHDRAHGS
jgi:hypothetical protein